MNTFFGYEPGVSLPLFGPAHLAALAVLCAGCVLLKAYGPRLGAWKHERLLRTAWACVTLSTEIGFKVWLGVHGKLVVMEILSFELCYLTLILSSVVFISGSFRLFEISWFWWFGGVLSVLIPIMGDNTYGPDRFRFYHYFLVHASFIWMNFYMLLAKGFRPTTRSYGKSMLVMVATVCAAYALNLLFGGNFMFLMEPPFHSPFIDKVYSASRTLYTLLFCLVIGSFGTAVTSLPLLLVKGPVKKPVPAGGREAPER